MAKAKNNTGMNVSIDIDVLCAQAQEALDGLTTATVEVQVSAIVKKAAANRAKRKNEEEA